MQVNFRGKSTDSLKEKFTLLLVILHLKLSAVKTLLLLGLEPVKDKWSFPFRGFPVVFVGLDETKRAAIICYPWTLGPVVWQGGHLLPSVYEARNGEQDLGLVGPSFKGGGQNDSDESSVEDISSPSL